METIVANFSSGKVRREKWNGQDYLVAPLTLIVPGVLNGNNGPLYYPPDEIAKATEHWNNIPITLRHPHSAEGRPISAKHGGTHLGILRNAAFSDKLTAEGWFLVNKLAIADPWSFRNISNGNPVELSTGLITHDEMAENGAEYNGRAYTHIARNHQPDHLAVLPDQVGACSLRDGCGVNVNADKGDGQLTAVEKLFALYKQTGETLAGIFSFDPDQAAENAQPKSKNTGRFKTPGASVGKGEIHERAQAGFAEAIITDRQRDLGIDAETQATYGHNPPSWVADEATWERAKEAAEKSGQPDNWALTTHIYENMGGAITSNTEDSTMDKKALVDKLVASCCWEEGDRPTLNAMTEDQLKRQVLKLEEDEQRVAVINAAIEGLGLPADMTLNAMPAALKEALAKKDGGGEEEEEEEEEEGGAPVKKKENTTPESKPQTENEWKKTAPPEVLADLNFARNERARQKGEAIEAIVINLEGDKKARLEKHLQGLDIDQIRDFTFLLPPPARRTANYQTEPPQEIGAAKIEPMQNRTWEFGKPK